MSADPLCLINTGNLGRPSALAVVPNETIRRTEHLIGETI
jgi:hypothetical protein